MLRRDGKVKIYQVVFLIDGEWSVASESFWNPVDQDLKYDSDKDRMNGKMKKPFSLFTANGPCWQKTGYFGTYKKNQAFRLAKILAEANPDREFAVRKAVLTRKTAIVAG